MTKKILIITSVLLLVFALASCGTVKPVEPAATPDTSNERDFKFETLRTVKFVSWSDESPIERNVSKLGDEIQDKLDFLSNKHNCKFEWEVQGEWGDAYVSAYSDSVMSGSNPVGDVVTVDSRWFFPDMVTKNVFYPVSDMDAIDLQDEDKWAAICTKMCLFRGAHYGLKANDFNPGTVTFFNKELLNKAGCKNPYDLIEGNNWTWDEFRTIARMTTTKTAEGETEVWGTVGENVLGLTLIMSNNVEIIGFDENSVPYWNLNTPNAIEAIEFCRVLLEDDKTWKTSETYDSPWPDFIAGKAATMGTLYFHYSEVKEGAPDLDYGITYIPMGPKATEYMSSCSTFSLYTFPANISQPQEIGYLYNKYTDRVPAFDEERRRSQWERSCCDDIAADLLYKIGCGTISSYYQWSSNFDKTSTYTYNIFSKIRKSGQSAATLAEKYEASSNKEFQTLAEGWMK